jgi:hypothetical protein
MGRALAGTISYKLFSIDSHKSLAVRFCGERTAGKQMRYDYKVSQGWRVPDRHNVKQDIAKPKSEKRDRTEEIALLILLVGFAGAVVLTAILH